MNSRNGQKHTFILFFKKVQTWLLGDTDWVMPMPPALVPPVGQSHVWAGQNDLEKCWVGAKDEHEQGLLGPLL